MTRKDLINPPWWRAAPPPAKVFVVSLSAIVAVVSMATGFTLKAQAYTGLPDRVSSLESSRLRLEAFDDSIRVRIAARVVLDSTEARDRRRMLCLLEGVATAVQDPARRQNPFYCEKVTP